MTPAFLASPDAIGVVAHSLAGLAFSFLAAFLAVAWSRGRREPWLLGACIATALWGWMTAYSVGAGMRSGPLVQIADLARSAMWLGLLFSIVLPMWSRPHRRVLMPTLAAAVGGLFLFNLSHEVFSLVRSPDVLAPPGSGWGGLGFISRVLVAIAGLLLVENLYRNMRPDYRWSVKSLCLGLGSLFAYDFFMYSDALLFKQIDPHLVDFRGVAIGVIAGLIALHLRHHPERSLTISVSRQTVFHTATFIGAGAYLLSMWAVAVYLREMGGHWGALLQAGFLFAAFLVLTAIMFSSGYRAWLRLMISKHFFRYRYDYRREWLRLIDTIASDRQGLTLAEKAIQAIADIVDSPEGVLWLVDQHGRFEPAGAWQTEHPERSHGADPKLVTFFEMRQWIVDLTDLADHPEVYGALSVPQWLRVTSRPWLIVPLIRATKLFGLIVLHQARAPRPLDWEDFDLLKTVGRQTAHFLAEQRSARALERSRQFDQFNRRFAFVLHDIKNLVSQLSLLLANAERHRDNPAFQQDMIATIQESVTKMNHLLVRLHQGGKDTAAASAIDLGGLLGRLVDRYSGAEKVLTFECCPETLSVLADEERLAAVMAHLIDNAVDAVKGAGTVRVRLQTNGDEAVIDIIDDGPGMEPEYVRNHLFQPFVSTKGGYGIGLYESRDYVREIGGRLDVTSQPGDGTSVRVGLPLLIAAQTGFDEAQPQSAE